MSITRLQQARQMYAMGQRVAKAFGGVMGDDGRLQYGGGSDMGKDKDSTDTSKGGYQGGPQGGYGDAGKSSPSNDGPSNDGPDNSPNIHGGPTYSTPTINPFDEVALTGYGKVPGVDYDYVGPNSQFAKNTYLTNNFPDYSFNSKIPSLNFIGNTLGRFGYNKNTKFFKENSIGGQINPATGKPFGYGIDGYRAYMKQRQLGNVGAYGGTELSQNEINRRAAGGDGTQGVMNVDVSDMTDDTTDATTTDDELILRFLGADSTLDPAAAGLASTDELRDMLLERARNLYT